MAEDRLRAAARQALDGFAPREGRFKMVGWYRAYAEDFDEAAQTEPDRDGSRLHAALAEECRRREAVLRRGADPDWLEPGWDNPL